jgi:hypothetical protein
MNLIRRTRFAATTLIACVFAFLAACNGGNDSAGSGGGSGGIAGVYTSVDSDDIKLEFSSGGSVVAIMAGEKGQPGTYTIDGEKIIVDFNGQKTTFIRDGDCIEDLQRFFGKMCKGGAAGATKNVSTRTPPPTAGTWVATNEDGEFTIEFKSESAFTMTMTPSAAIPNAGPEARDATFVIEEDTIHARFDDGMTVVLKWVNGAYESMAFGLPMKFVRQ